MTNTKVHIDKSQSNIAIHIDRFVKPANNTIFQHFYSRVHVQATSDNADQPFLVFRRHPVDGRLV